MRHVNIPVFIPHLGCPNQCIFCNQRSISGVQTFDAEDVREIVDRALATVNADDECEIAFFGGSFTGIDRDLMIRLLDISREYLSSGRISSVRCSTRPDYINEDIVGILKEYGVMAVELGLQSISPRVLRLTKRGHSVLDAKEAMKLLVSRGFEVGGQMMIGLPGSTLDDEIATARFIVENGAKTARIYPTVVLKDTELCSLAERGEYIPLPVDEAVRRSSAVMRIFIDSGVKVLRIGLCDSESLHNERTYYSGPNHPALGELVLGELFYDIIKDKLTALYPSLGDEILITVARGCTSKAVGHKGKNKLRLINEYGLSSVSVREDDSLAEYDVLVEKRKDIKCI